MYILDQSRERYRLVLRRDVTTILPTPDLLIDDLRKVGKRNFDDNEIETNCSANAEQLLEAPLHGVQFCGLGSIC